MDSGGGFDPRHMAAAEVTQAEHPTHVGDDEPPRSYSWIAWTVSIVIFGGPIVYWVMDMLR